MKLAFISLSILIIALCVYFFMPQSSLEIDSETVTDKTQQPAVEVSAESANTDAQQLSEEDLLYQKKQDTYADLEKARRNLDRVVARIKAYSWNKRIPKEKAEAINSELLNAHGLLKNKKLLGAFKDLESIENELNKVQYSYSEIKEFIKYIKGLNSTE